MQPDLRLRHLTSIYSGLGCGRAAIALFESARLLAIRSFMQAMHILHSSSRCCAVGLMQQSLLSLVWLWMTTSCKILPPGVFGTTGLLPTIKVHRVQKTGLTLEVLQMESRCLVDTE